MDLNLDIILNHIRSLHMIRWFNVVWTVVWVVVWTVVWAVVWVVVWAVVIMLKQRRANRDVDSNFD